MHYIIHCLDHPGGVARRLENYEAHKAYLIEAKLNILVSGPLLDTDGKTMIGSLFLAEAESQDEVMAFHHADPFYKANVWREVKIHPFLKRVDNRFP